MCFLLRRYHNLFSLEEKFKNITYTLHFCKIIKNKTFYISSYRFKWTFNMIYGESVLFMLRKLYWVLL